MLAGSIDLVVVVVEERTTAALELAMAAKIMAMAAKKARGL
jgi:hypothetical protein